MKIEFFKKEKNFKKESFTFNPSLYWKLAVFGAFIMIIFSFYLGYRLFQQVNQELVVPTTNSSGQIVTVKEDYMKKVLDYFSVREKKSIEILNSPAPIIDPSL